MPVEHWVATPDVVALAEEVKQEHKHLQEALFAIEFVDSKPFRKDRLNLGKVSKFSKAAKLWHPKEKKFDFCISLCMDVWKDILNAEQKKALLDLHFCRCKVEYEAETVDVNGKTEKVKDEWGRVSYTDVIKRDDEGRPLFKVEPLDIRAITENIGRFGPWYEDLINLQKILK